MPRTALFMDIEPPTLDQHSQTYTQTSPGLSHSQRFKIGTELGRGGYGIAYTLIDTSNRWRTLPKMVVKLPRLLVDEEAAARHCTLDEAVSWETEDYALADTMQADFTAECRNAEAILDPPYLRQLNPSRSPGQGYSDLTLAQRQRLEEATRTWRSTPGCDHVHTVLHFDPDVPLLLSERAEGSLIDLRERWQSAFAVTRRTTRDPPLWRDLLGRQLGAAVGFILTHAPIAHLDIKPGNLLYTMRSPGVFHLQLSDFGLCAPKSERATLVTDEVRPHFCGTPPYIPEIQHRGWTRLFPTNQTLSLFQYFATALGCLSVPVSEFDPNELRFVDAIEDAPLAESALQWVIPPPSAGNALLRCAVRAVRSDAPEDELLALFRELHSGLAIHSDSP